MSLIMLGNQTVPQIEKRLNITLSEEHRNMLNSSRQENVSKPLENGKWHCYDIPFMFMCSDKETATKWRDIFMTYDLSKAETFQLSWEH